MLNMTKTDPDATTSTRTFKVEELEALDIGPWNCLANIEGDGHRWYTVRHLIFEYEGRYWAVDYMDPASEIQEDQTKWTDSDNDDDLVTAVEVHQVAVTVKQWQPVLPAIETIDNATDPFVDWTVDQIAEGLNEMCDGGAPGSQDAPFGSYARPTQVAPNVLIVRPNDQAEDWEDGHDEWVEQFEMNAKGFPERPVVRIIVERVEDPDEIAQINQALIERDRRPIAE